MTSGMIQPLARYTNRRGLVILPLLGLFVALAARGPLGIDADPLRIIGTFLIGVFAVVLAVRHPAAFVAPVLFLPRDKEISALSGLGAAGEVTALGLAGGLLAAGLVLRLILHGKHPKDQSVGEITPNASSFGRAHKAFLFFAAMVSLSYLYTPAPSYGAEKLWGFLTLGVGLFLAVPVMFATDRDFKDLAAGTVVFGAIVAVSSLSFSATGAMGAHDNAAHIGKGQVIALATLMLLYTPVTHPWLRRVVMFVLIPILALGLVSAETRGPLFSLVFVLFLSFFVQHMRSPLVTRRQMAIVAAVLVCAMSLLSMFWFYGTAAAKFQYKTAETLALLEGDSEARGTAVQRLGYYSAAIDASLQHPFTGWGIGGWSMAYWRQDERQYPHNLLLEVLVEQGFLGLSLLTFFLLSVFRELRSSMTETAGRLPFLLPCGIYLLSIAMFSGDLDDSRFVWFWCGLTLEGCAAVHRWRPAAGQLKNGNTMYGFTQPSAGAASLSPATEGL